MPRPAMVVAVAVAMAVVLVSVAQPVAMAVAAAVVMAGVLVAVQAMWMWMSTLLPWLVEVVVTHASTVARWLQATAATARSTWQCASHCRRMCATCWTTRPYVKAARSLADTGARTVVCTVDSV